MSSSKIVVLAFLSLIIKASLAVSLLQASTVLTSPKITNFGLWGEWDRCPLGTFVMGMKLKVEPYQG
jgi:hypothetical protein